MSKTASSQEVSTEPVTPRAQMLAYLEKELAAQQKIESDPITLWHRMRDLYNHKDGEDSNVWGDMWRAELADRLFPQSVEHRRILGEREAIRAKSREEMKANGVKTSNGSYHGPLTFAEPNPFVLPGKVSK